MYQPTTKFREGETEMGMHVVMTSSAQMPSKVRAPYRNVAVVQLTQEFTSHNWRPKMISTRAKGVLRLYHLGHHFVGKTEKCAYRKALARADDMAYRMNNVRDMATIQDIIGAGGSA